MARALLTAAILALALPAAAQTHHDQTTPAPTTQADCDAGVTLMQVLIPADSPPEGAALTDGSCRVADVSFGWPGDDYRRRIAQVDWQAPGLAAAMDRGPPPLWVALRLDGIAVQYSTGNARIDYQLDVQSRVPGAAIDAELALRLDTGQELLVLDRLRIALPMGNLVEFQVQVETAPWPPETPWAEAFDGPDALRVTKIDLVLELRCLFEYHILPPLLDRVDEDDPARAIAALKTDLTDALATAAPTRLSPNSRAAAERLLSDLPDPHGRLTLRLQSDRGLYGDALIGLDLTRPAAALRQILALFDGAEAVLTYDR